MLAILAAAALSHAILIEDRSQANLSIKGELFREIEWSSKPNAKTVAAMLPPHSKTWRYGNIKCKSISVKGYLKGCVVAASDYNDAVVDRASLRLSKFFKVQKSLIEQRSHIQDIYISLRFKYSGKPDSRCGAPFCTMTPPPPSPPT